MPNFFISYNKADSTWAEWIAWQLEEAGYTTILQAWDFRPSENFVIKLNEAIRESERTVAVLSPDYESAFFTRPEWAAAFAQDPTSDRGVLLPVRVRECDLTGLFKQIIYVDLVGKDEEEARDALLSGIRRDRAKPLTKPKFPGGIPRSVSEHPSFPGAATRKVAAKRLIALSLVFAVAAAGLYAFWSAPFTPMPEPSRPCLRLEAGASHYYEAEDAELSGDASLDAQHDGHSGDGYISGYGHGHPGTGTTFRVDVPAGGRYRVDLCYANGTGSAKRLTIYVNEERVRQIHLPSGPRWDVWLTQTESLPLRSGPNTVSYRKSPSDNGEVNLDFIRVIPEPAAAARPPSTPAPAPRPDAGTPTPPRPGRVRCTAENRLLGLC